MTRRISALEGYYHKGVFGKKDNLSVVITEVRNLILYQVAVWPDTLNDVGKKIAESLNLPEFPEANKGFSTNEVSMLRLEPLKWWVIGREILEIAAEEGSILDLSHSRTHIRISGKHATTLLNRHLPVDLRDVAFPVNSVASTAFHHVSITLWRSKKGYELFLPRAFALSLWEVLLESAAQFGYEIK